MLFRSFDEPDERLRREAHRALVTLSFEDVKGAPAETLVSDDPEAAARTWKEAWDHFRSRKVEARANSALKLADAVRDRQKAAERYHQVIRDFPGTSAAEKATERLNDPLLRKRSVKGLDLTKQ